MATKKKSAKKSTKKTAKSSSFFSTGKRGTRNVKRRQFHVLLASSEYAKLTKLTKTMKLSAADVVRTLIDKAK